MSGTIATERITPQPVTWFAAQKRPFIGANIVALCFLLVMAMGALIQDAPGIPLARLMWPGLLYYAVLVFSSLLPLWLVQLIIYTQMWQMGQPQFISVHDAEQLDQERQCRFLLAVRREVFVLSVLYVETRAKDRYWIRPAWLYLSLFALGLLAFCLWTIAVPLLPPPQLIFAITFWTSALIFGMGHLVAGD